MKNKEKEVLRRILGEVQFRDLNLAFRNGVLWTGPSYSSGYSFLGFSGVCLSQEGDGRYHFFLI